MPVAPTSNRLKKPRSVFGVREELFPPVSAIIPAYNEAQRIGKLLDVLRQVSYLTEIIVVDDGSRDQTSPVVLRAASLDPRVTVIRHESNLGKGQAIMTGSRAAHTQFLLFLDADLHRIYPEHIEALVFPVIQDQADMTVGIFQGGGLIADLSHRATPWLSGQRCLRAELLNDTSPEAADGYGIETALTIAARRNIRRVTEVRLRGVLHSPYKFQRGLLGGARRRAKKFGDIARAMHVTQGWRVFAPQVRLEARFFIILLLLLIGSSLAFNRSRAASHLNLSEIPLIDLTENQRLLVISPHPDDETLGAGGLIQAALAQGLEVKVVLMTNGDGQAFAPLALDYRFRTDTRYYLAHGERRQVETVEALTRLGVSEDDIFFLGYPDRRLLALWLGNWERDCPVQAVFTRAVHNPYLNSYNPLAKYCGNDVLTDIKEIISRYLPDLVVIPHPNDDHSDHRAAGNFTRLALAMQREENPEYEPTVLGYLIHYGYYPQPRGYSTLKPLLPPIPLAGEQNQWVRIDLHPDEVLTKLAALKQYPTQMRLLGKFLPSFARPNEIFINLAMTKVMPIEFTTLPLQETGVKEYPILPEPNNESTSRMMLAGADLVSWNITRLGDHLLLTANTRGKLLPGLQYRILVKTPSGETKIIKHKNPDTLPGRSSFSAKINLEELGDPNMLAFAAEVQQGLTMDRTGWYFLELKEWLP